MGAYWYFGRNKNENIGLCTALGWSFFYHLGSLTFGSILLAIIWFI